MDGLLRLVRWVDALTGSDPSGHDAPVPHSMRGGRLAPDQAPTGGRL